MTSCAATAIVLNYDGRGFVEEAVASLLDQSLEGLDVLVVDNGSRDGSDGEIERRFGERVRVLRMGRNLGFGAGNNAGIRESRGRHVILLNADAVAAQGFAVEMVAAADRDPRVGMVAAKVLDYARRDVIDTAGHLLYPDGLNRGRGRLEPDRGQYDGQSEALFPSGAAALYRRAMLEEIGLFDESFFLYGEDADLGLRGRLAGWECAFAPRAVAHHHYSRSAGAYSSLKAFHVERNRVLVLLKHFPWPLVVLSPGWTALRLALQAWGALTGRGAAGRLAQERSFAHLVVVVLRAYASAAARAPSALRERRRACGLRRLSHTAFLRLLREHRLSAREAALKD
ncbi:MAG: glycosyltransferase family 2 protein [Acidobacteria bacterium]|nr:glycosyltransferase family 2 protein [Acidobacteriota bacterium]